MNKMLKKIFDDDQAERKNYDNWLDQEKVREMGKRDARRRAKVQEIVDQGLLIDPEDYFHAAIIFQHGNKPKDYKLANKLAKRAVDMGYDTARRIYAATLDRWLLSEGKLQKFGTQYGDNGHGQITLIEPIDPNTTDEERVKYNVKPLAEIPKIFKP